MATIGRTFATINRLVIRSTISLGDDVISIDQPNILVLFPSPIGWCAMIGSGNIGSGNQVKRLSFGHRTSQAAAEAIEPQLAESAELGSWNESLVHRLQAYASGTFDDFRDIEIDPGPLTHFRRRVIQHCREIPPGQTITYGQLASRAGSPAAARAVGNCMAANRIPIIVPCHRVVASGGSLGGFSAPGGITTKRRLLELESTRMGGIDSTPKWQAATDMTLT